jgi:hypothetical protein
MDAGISHGFGRRGSQIPEKTKFPRQVHGIGVVTANDWAAAEAPPGDAILSSDRASSVGIVTADCVPILASVARGSRVAAIHAGWRGLAAGVIEAGLAALAETGPERDFVAAIGPAARGCCYEVDEPVRQALAQRYADWLEPAILVPGRGGRYQLDLPLLATRILIEIGVEPQHLGTTHRVCSVCDAERFESYRRDGEAAGRLRHFIARREAILGQG